MQEGLVNYNTFCIFVLSNITTLLLLKAGEEK